MLTILRLAGLSAMLSGLAFAAGASDDYQKAVDQVQALIKDGETAQAAKQAQALQIPRGLSGREKSRAYLNRAELFNLLGKGDEALNDLRVAVSEDPGNLELVGALALGLSSSGRAVEALIYADYVCLEQSAANSKEDRADALIERAVIEMSLDRDGRAEKDLAEALRLAPNDLTGLRAAVSYWRKRGRPSKGLVYADRAVAATRGAAASKLAVALVDRARLRMELSEYDKAEGDIKEALAAVPRDSAALSAMSQCLLRQGRDAEAVAFSTGTPLAELEFKLGHYAQGQAVVEQALKADPNNVAALDAMVQGLAAQSRFTEAMPFADRAVAAAQALPDPARARRYAARAELNMSLGDFPKAQEDFQKAVQEDPSLADSRLRLAVAFERQANYKDALETIDQAVAFSSGSARDQAGLLTARFAIALESGDRSTAEANLRRALALDAKQACLGNLSFVKRSEMDQVFFDSCLTLLPRESTLLADRGVARYLNGQRDAAVEDLNAALKLRPDYLEAAMSLCVALEGPQKEKARIVIDKALAAAAKRKTEPVYREALAVQASLNAGK